MKFIRKAKSKRNKERGATLILIAAAMAFILVASALAIDLGSLYVQRSQAQRAADAGALAGAEEFTGGCALDGSCLGGTVEAAASSQATSVAQQNLIFGRTPAIQNIAFSAGGGNPTDPLITVTVQAPAITFFLPLSAGAMISASATAEAYQPSPSGPTFCASCIKPFFVPNCDPVHVAPLNSNCPTPAGYFFQNGSVVNGSSVVGEQWQLHLQTSGNIQKVASQWLEVDFDQNALQGCNSTGSQSATDWANSVTQCATNQLTCGSKLCTLNGAKVGPNNQAVCSLISYGTAKGNQCTATDSVSCGNGSCTVQAGSGNPFSNGGAISPNQSAAVVTVPVYDGAMQPGGGVVEIVGYMQIFLRDIKHQGQFDNIDAVIMNATTCGSIGGGCSATGGGTGPTGSVSGGGGALIPVRLVHQ